MERPEWWRGDTPFPCQALEYDLVGPLVSAPKVRKLLETTTDSQPLKILFILVTLRSFWGILSSWSSGPRTPIKLLLGSLWVLLRRRRVLLLSLLLVVSLIKLFLLSNRLILALLFGHHFLSLLTSPV